MKLLHRHVSPAECPDCPIERMHETCAQAWSGAHDDSHLADASGFPEG